MTCKWSAPIKSICAMSESPRHRDLGAEAIITPYLTEGETLRWAGRPARFPMPKYALLVYALGFLFCLHSLGDSPRALPVHILVAIILFFTLHLFSISCQIYGVTNRRIIICNRVFMGQVYRVPFAPHMWKRRIQSKRNSHKNMGTLYIYDSPNSILRGRFVRPIFVPQHSWFFKIVYKGRLAQALFNIEDSAYVESLLPPWHKLGHRWNMW